MSYTWEMMLIISGLIAIKNVGNGAERIGRIKQNLRDKSDDKSDADDERSEELETNSLESLFENMYEHNVPGMKKIKH